jgi:hypothetical protein
MSNTKQPQKEKRFRVHPPPKTEKGRLERQIGFERYLVQMRAHFRSQREDIERSRPEIGEPDPESASPKAS